MLKAKSLIGFGMYHASSYPGLYYEIGWLFGCEFFLTIFPSPYNHEIFRSDYINQSDVCSKVKVKGQGHMSKDKVIEVKTPFRHLVTHDKKLSILTQIEYFWAVTPVLIHWWLQKNARGLKWHRRGALLFFKVICQVSRSHRQKMANLTPIKDFPNSISKIA